MPAALQHWLDNWGQSLQDKIHEAASQARAGGSDAPAAILPKLLKLGTDCSGVEAPVHALRGLRVQHTHVFASEIAPAPRRMIRANSMPAKLYKDLLTDPAAEFVHLYVSGFSCKPFSMLHHGSKLLEEEQAQVFYGVVRRISSVLPACFVLENVLGISRVKSEVLACLRQGYLVEMLRMDPVDLGEPVRRPRYYFIGVRLDLCNMSPGNVQAYLSKAWMLVKKSCKARKASILDRLLPGGHPIVAQHQALRKRRWLQAQQRGFPGGKAHPKWPGLHAEFASAHGLQCRVEEPGAQNFADNLYLHLPRERHAWALLSKKHEKAASFTVDLSQNLGRNSVRVDGSLPTVTPGGVLIVREAGRVLTPMEKLIVHGIPVHRLIWPDGLADQDVASMGGNTMHVHIVAVAMMFAASPVDRSLEAAHLPRLPSVAVFRCPGPSSVLGKRKRTQAPRSKARKSKAPRSRRKVAEKTSNRGKQQKQRSSERKKAVAFDLKDLASRWATDVPKRKKASRRSPRNGTTRCKPGKLQNLASRWYSCS